MIELRRFSRAPLEVPLKFSTKGASSVAPGEGEARDISLGGMFVETAVPVTFGAELSVELALPGQKGALSLPGIVRWVGKGGMGIQFKSLGAKETYAITEYVRQSAK